jgi:ribonuclease HII
MAIVIGIDEAGLGPVLGPFVVSGAAFAVPDALADESFWELLSPAVSLKASRKSSSISVNDSKKLFNRKKSDGLVPLERGVLAMIAAAGRAPASFAELLATLADDAQDARQAYPWYRQDSVVVPAQAGAQDVVLAGKAVAAELTRRGMKILGLRSQVVFAKQFNELLAATRNKASTTIGVTARLLARGWALTERDRVIIHVDRQGGRVRYHPVLERLFPDVSIRIVQEDEIQSIYHLRQGSREAEIHFSVGGEEKHLPVALASMISKYLRELFMMMLNDFWRQHLPDLAPTAGYYTDGRRFFQQIQPLLGDMNIDETMMYRQK